MRNRMRELRRLEESKRTWKENGAAAAAAVAHVGRVRVARRRQQCVWEVYVLLSRMLAATAHKNRTIQNADQATVLRYINAAQPMPLQ